VRGTTLNLEGNQETSFSGELGETINNQKKVLVLYQELKILNSREKQISPGSWEKPPIIKQRH
jgi:hypothetical protein